MQLALCISNAVASDCEPDMTSMPHEAMDQISKPVLRRRFRIKGIVQGVGFRPWIYRLATEQALTGTVLNNSAGVCIEIQGNTASVGEFTRQLGVNRPPLARIDSLMAEDIPSVEGETAFDIIESEQQQEISVSVSPDKACCDDCLADVRNPDSRYFEYPFTNCTNCGPRYTIIQALPYDRPNTAMAGFTMCPECAAEYKNPLNRRYHAQPVSCPHCGPQLSLLTPEGEVIARKADALTQACDALVQGKIVAVKGLGGFHLMVDATNQVAVERLRQRKRRQGKPLAVMVADMAQAKALVTGCEQEWQLLESAERPIVLLDKLLLDKLEHSPLDSNPGSETNSHLSLAKAIAPGLGRLGLFMPYTPLHHLMFTQVSRPLVATSANISGEPILTDSTQVLTHLGQVVDLVLDHNRPILNGCDDSLVHLVDGKLQVIRLARGYAPLSLPLDEQSGPQIRGKDLLAVGPQQKNTLALAVGNQMILSPHIGDLFTLESEAYFERTLATFQRLYQTQPDQLYRDCHPDYASSRWAEARSRQVPAQVTTVHKIQHHYAHVLAVMAANGITHKLLGFSFDGTGLGEDNTLWGGELLLCDIHGYQRIGHFAPFALIGMEQAVKQPWRLLLALLFEHHSPEQILKMELAVLADKPQQLIRNLHTLWSKHQRTIQSSSAGRLFDALAALLGLVDDTGFEGEAGMKLEALATGLYRSGVPLATDCHFIIPIVDAAPGKPQLWDSYGLFEQLLMATQAQELTATRRQHIALGFHQALADLVVACARHYPELKIALCGGVFQNRLLYSLCQQGLSTETQTQTNEHRLLSPGQVPVNDGGIALGQLWYGTHHQSKQ
ncbi:carbamoyltransferase HypF [Shewanella submarina]|uniref:Carbamoyltransferase HypF n=1 Tax=Shewanella submarina TaxID=2016376 RepID=A0ABV7GGR3_9GAMM|nr:carbamoyltransferase HypF [Shewanella submarina]MCL1039198.1 carbamoyltransferase HypF [Shewanella submarina]